MSAISLLPLSLRTLLKRPVDHPTVVLHALAQARRICLTHPCLLHPRLCSGHTLALSASSTERIAVTQ